MRTVKISILFLIILCQLTIFAEEIFAYYPMETFPGNCLPQPISGVTELADFNISSDTIITMCFLDENQIIVYSLDGIISKVDLVTEEITVLDTIEQSNSARLVPIGSDHFMISLPVGYCETISRLYDESSELLWSVEFQKGTSIVAYDNNYIYINYTDSEENRKLNIYSITGQLVDEVSLPSASRFLLYATNIGILLTDLDMDSGPYILNCNDCKYEINLINEKYVNDGGHLIVDKNNRVIHLTNLGSEMAILDYETGDVDLVDIWDQSLDYGWYSDYGWFASNGETILILHPHQLQSYRDNNLTVIHEFIEDDEVNTCLGFYIGPDANTFVIFLSSGFIVGNPDIEYYESEWRRSTELYFSPDFTHAVFGTYDGEIFLVTLFGNSLVQEIN